MTDWTMDELAAAIRARKVSAAEVTAECLARIGRLDGRLRAFITVDAEGALACARDLDADAAAGRWRGPLHGVPLALQGPLPHPRLADVVRDEDGRVLHRRGTTRRR